MTSSLLSWIWVWLWKYSLLYVTNHFDIDIDFFFFHLWLFRFPLLHQTVIKRVWRLTKSRQHSSHTPHWQRLDAGSSLTTSFSQRKSWQCGKRILRVLVIAHPQIHGLNPTAWTYLDMQIGRFKRHLLGKSIIMRMARLKSATWFCLFILIYTIYVVNTSKLWCCINAWQLNNRSNNHFLELWKTAASNKCFSTTWHLLLTVLRFFCFV